MGFVKDAWDDITGKSAAEDMRQMSLEAGETAAGSKREELEYLKEINKLPQQIREQALKQYSGAMGLPGFEGVDLTQQAMQSPLYQAQIGNIDDMTQRAIDQSLSTASATGGLRGGNLQRGFGDIAERQQLAKNQALGGAYQDILSGLGSLSGLNTGQNQIAQAIGDIGNIQAQSMIGGAQSAQSAQQAGMQNLLGLGGLGVGIAGLPMFSDRRLKTNIIKVDDRNGLPWYTWEWNDAANDIGLVGNDEGHIADEVKVKYPEAVTVDYETGYEKVNYGVING